MYTYLHIHYMKIKREKNRITYAALIDLCILRKHVWIYCFRNNRGEIEGKWGRIIIKYLA